MLGQDRDIVERCLEGEVWEVGAEQVDLLPNLVRDVDVREMGTDAINVWKAADEVLERKVEVEVW